MRPIKFKAQRVSDGEWVDIPKYEGFYQANRIGQVRSIDRYVNHWQGGLCVKKGTLMKMHPNHKGYLLVRLSINGVSKSVQVHRIIAKTFLPNKQNKPQVNHINGDKLDNNVSNLEWCTQSENMKHAFKTGLKSSPTQGLRGLDNPKFTLTEKSIKDINNRYNNGTRVVDLATMYSVSTRTIYRAISNYIGLIGNIHDK